MQFKCSLGQSLILRGGFSDVNSTTDLHQLWCYHVQRVELLQAKTNMQKNRQNINVCYPWRLLRQGWATWAT